MEPAQKAVNIRLRVPVFITFTGIAEIAVISQFLQILVLYAVISVRCAQSCHIA